MKLGKNQESVLRALIKHKGWMPGCGWVWSTRSETLRIMQSLVKKGLAIETTYKGTTAFYPVGKPNPYKEA